MLRNNRGQVFAIIEILVVAVIILGAAYFLVGNYAGAAKKSKPGEPATPMDRAVGVDCKNNLQQIRYAIQLTQQSGEEEVALPATLHELADKQGLSKSMEKCPVSGKDYTYDPAKALVSCTTPRHEAY